MSKYITTSEICENFGVSYKTIHRWRQNTRLPFPNPIYRGRAGKDSMYIKEQVDTWEANGGLAIVSGQATN